MIAVAFRDVLPEDTAAEFDQLVQGITAFAYREHDQDGHHTNITADSLTMNPPSLTRGVLGTIIFQDEHGNQTVFSRTDTDGTVITLRNGQALLIQSTDPAGAITQLVRLGKISTGAFVGAGIELMPLFGAPTNYRDWAIVSGQANFGNAASLHFIDKSAGISPMNLRWRGATGGWELMKTVGSQGPTIEPVTLGSGLDSSLQGFWDAAYIKRIFLQTAAGANAEVGVQTAILFDAGNFSGAGGQTWTLTSPDQVSYNYLMVGKQITLTFRFESTSVGGTPNPVLLVKLPNGWLVGGTETYYNFVFGIDNGTLIPVQAIAAPGATQIQFYKNNELNWSASADATYIRGQITFAIA